MKDDLEKYIEKRKKRDKDFALDFEVGYEKFKIGAMLKVLRENSGITQEQLAEKLNTKKSAISRIENHAEDIRISTILNYAKVFNKNVYLRIG